MESRTCLKCGSCSTLCYHQDVGGVEYDDEYILHCQNCGYIERKSEYGGSPMSENWTTRCPYCGVECHLHKNTPPELWGYGHYYKPDHQTQEKKSMMPGLLIAFEGIDNAGKTTQCLKLAKKLKTDGFTVVVSRQDFIPPISQLISIYFRECHQYPSANFHSLLFTARTFHELDILVRSALMRDEIAIFDRYIYSILAYGQMLKVDIKWLQDILRPADKPDLIIYLDITVAEYRQKIQGREVYISPFSDELLEKVRNGFHFYLKETENSLIIDGCLTEDIIATTIYQKVLEKKKGKKLDPK